MSGMLGRLPNLVRRDRKKLPVHGEIATFKCSFRDYSDFFSKLKKNSFKIKIRICIAMNIENLSIFIFARWFIEIGTAFLSVDLFRAFSLK